MYTIDSFTAKYRDIVGVVFCTQMHGFVYATQCKANKYVSWQDMRCLNMASEKSENYMDLLRKKFSYEEMKCCGVYIKPSLGMCNLWTLFQTENLTRNGELYTLGSYILSKLTGKNTCHPQNAAPLGFFNVLESKWDYRIIKDCGFQDLRLPAIAQDDFKPVGELLSNGLTLTVFPDYGDQQSSVLGSMADYGDAVINISTGAQVVVPTRTFAASIEYETRPYFEGTFIKTISNMPGGRGLDVLVNFLRTAVQEITGDKVPVENVWNAVHKSFKPEANGIRVDTCFYPVPGNLGGGKIQGILPSNLNLSSLFAAAFLDMGLTYYENIMKITADNSIDRIICAGGVSWKTPELLKTIEDVFRIKEEASDGEFQKKPNTTKQKTKCLLSAIEDEALCGLFRSALVCSGKYKKIQDTIACVEGLDK